MFTSNLVGMERNYIISYFLLLELSRLFKIFSKLLCYSVDVYQRTKQMVENIGLKIIESKI